MIEVSNISVHLSGKTVLSEVSFTGEAGEHIALVGPNGAGKTTLLRVLAGLLKPDTGAVTYNGEALSELPPSARAQSLSYLPQARKLAWDLTGGDVAALGLFAWGARRYHELQGEAKRAVDAALEKTGASEFAGRSVRTLSGGERARIHLARTLAPGSDAVLLDEPCASLDIRRQLELMQSLDAERAAGKIIITVLHDLELAERFATRLIVLEAGRLVADVPARDPLSDDILARVFQLTRRKNGGFFPAETSTAATEPQDR